MFSYYGSKGKIVDCYPPPKHKKVIEPFAGSARYSLKYFDKDVTIYDKYPVIIDVWKYLQEASESDILGLPRLERGEKF
jgi:site-specific DNA-adenine methylase